MSVTAPQGFVAAGVAAGLKSKGGKDFALVVNRGPSTAAAVVFTSNRAKANPVIWSQRVIAAGSVQAVVLNSGGANCFTGIQGYETTEATAVAVAEHLGGAAAEIIAEEILVCSTGLIGEQLDRAKILAGVEGAVAALGGEGDDSENDDGEGDDSTSGGFAAADAILTTDTHRKTAVYRGAGWTIGAMAKGAGMLAPGLATMLVVITTDADLTSRELDTALREATRVSFDRLDSDGCMSTNDQVTLMASGATGITPDVTQFQTALTAVCANLARQLQGDAEGASHDITIEVVNAATELDAVEVGRSVARNNLFKAAIFGNDPNWGRVLAAIGTTHASFDPYDVDVSMNGIRVCHLGAPDQPRDLVDLTGRAVAVRIDLKAGIATATILTNDLTHEYVHENSAYSS